jgi:tripartite ATP-independent transporter DctP family solute receptor
MRKKLLVIVLGLAFCAIFTTCSKKEQGERNTGGQKYILKMAYSIAGTDPTPVIAEEMAERIAKRTNGGLTLQAYPNAELATDVDALEQVARGSNVMALGTPDFLAIYIPDLGVLDGPYLFKSPDEFKKLEESGWMAEMRTKLEAQNIKNLSMSWYFGARHLTHSLNKDIITPSALSGVRIRSANSPMRVAMIETMGATVTTMPWNEVYSALNQGVMEGCEAPLATLYNSKIYEVCKRISLTNHLRSIWSVNVSKQWFDSLPAEYRQVLIEEVNRSAEDSRRVVLEGEAEWRKKLEAEGVRVVDVDEDAFRKACSAAYDKISTLTPGIYSRMRGMLDK